MTHQDAFNKVVVWLALLACMFGCTTTQASTTTSPQAAGNSIALGDDIEVKQKDATRKGNTKPEVSESQVPPEGEEPAFEVLEAALLVTGDIWWKYRFSDYVVRAVGREHRKYDRKSDVTTFKRKYEVVAPTGAKAKIKMESRNFWSVEHIDPSPGDVLIDVVTESAWGWSLLDYEPDPIFLKYVASSRITLTDAPDETWQLGLEILPVPEGEWLGSYIEWGHGTLTNGVRTLELVVHGASPFGEQECLQMSSSGKHRRQYEQCRIAVAEIKEDGELLAWQGDQSCNRQYYSGREYCFRIGLDVNTKMLLLAMFASMLD